MTQISLYSIDVYPDGIAVRARAPVGKLAAIVRLAAAIEECDADAIMLGDPRAFGLADASLVMGTRDGLEAWSKAVHA